MRPSLLPSFLREIRFRKRFHNNHIYHIYGKCCKSQTKVATQSAHLLDKCPSMYVHICLRVCECKCVRVYGLKLWQHYLIALPRLLRPYRTGRGNQK